MKKLLVMLLIVTAMVMAVACKKEKKEENVSVANDVSTETIMRECQKSVSTTDWTTVDKSNMQDYFEGITADDVEEITGFTLDAMLADEIIIIKAKEGKADAVYSSLEKYWEKRKKSFDGYIQTEYQRIDNQGKVVLMKLGNYVIYAATENNSGVKSAFENSLKK